MATYHFSIKSGKRGKAASHASYITREGKHGKRKEDLVAAASGNLPQWTNGNPISFWQAADQHERINGAAYREFELALPVELSIEQNKALVREFVKTVVGEKPYQVAIHMPSAALGGCPQPHAHLMFSDRLPDGIERTADQHFRRFNRAYPNKGGCKKDSGGKSPTQVREDLKSVRQTWETMQNAALEKNGHIARVDSRSHVERGIARRPERHLGQAAVRKMTEEDRELLRQQRSSAAHKKAA